MLNRRHLRIKVLQILYAYYNDKDSDDIKLSRKNLLDSIERIYDLYVYFLLSFTVLKDISLTKQEERKDRKSVV